MNGVLLVAVSVSLLFATPGYKYYPDSQLCNLLSTHFHVPPNSCHPHFLNKEPSHAHSRQSVGIGTAPQKSYGFNRSQLDGICEIKDDKTSHINSFDINSPKSLQFPIQLMPSCKKTKTGSALSMTGRDTSANALL
jgi:hypothetical protein